MNWQDLLAWRNSCWRGSSSSCWSSVRECDAHRSPDGKKDERFSRIRELFIEQVKPAVRVRTQKPSVRTLREKNPQPPRSEENSKRGTRACLWDCRGSGWSGTAVGRLPPREARFRGRKKKRSGWAECEGAKSHGCGGYHPIYGARTVE